MIKGIALGISLATSVTSAIIIYTSKTGILRENMSTGAVVGTDQIASYAITSLTVSIIASIFLALLIMKKSEY